MPYVAVLCQVGEPKRSPSQTSSPTHDEAREGAAGQTPLPLDSMDDEDAAVPDDGSPEAAAPSEDAPPEDAPSEAKQKGAPPA